jgi:hypothetical protein
VFHLKDNEHINALMVYGQEEGEHDFIRHGKKSSGGG